MGDDIEKRQYHKFFQRECTLTLGLVVLGLLTHPLPFLIPSAVLAVDIGVRGVKDNYRENPSPGLIGIIREKYNSRID